MHTRDLDTAMLDIVSGVPSTEQLASDIRRTSSMFGGNHLEAAPESLTAPLSTGPQSGTIPLSLSEHRAVDMEIDVEQTMNKDVSDAESIGDPQTDRPKKKTKGQRFYCIGYPPCSLTFTRSEHLARHVRKHTGERPYGCFCGRFFSRLDNLRQHAQTVHGCDDVSGGSVASTGARFPRQIRGDRGQVSTGRPRASTFHSFTAPSRGHGRNLSASSIASSVSTISIRSSEPRSRPVSSYVPNEQASSIGASSSFSPSISGASYHYGYLHSPMQGLSERAGPGQSGGPSTLFSRATFDFERPTATSRRVSVPASSFAAMRATDLAPQKFDFPASPVTAGVTPNSSNMMPPPTPLIDLPSVGSHRRSESEQEADWRRRTWHSGALAAYTPRRATSSLVYQRTPEDKDSRPSSQSAASQATRLPGIASFDHGPLASSHARRMPSISMRSGHTRLPSLQAASISPEGLDDRRAYSQWEAGLHHNLNRLDIATSPRTSVTRPVSEHLPRAPLFTGFDVTRVQQHPRPDRPPIPISDRPVSTTSSSEGVLTPGTSYDHDAQTMLSPMSDDQPRLASREEQSRRDSSNFYKPGPMRTDSVTQVYTASRSLSTVDPLVLPNTTTTVELRSCPPRTDLDRLNTLAYVSSAQSQESRS